MLLGWLGRRRVVLSASSSSGWTVQRAVARVHSLATTLPGPTPHASPQNREAWDRSHMSNAPLFLEEAHGVGLGRAAGSACTPLPLQLLLNQPLQEAWRAVQPGCGSTHAAATLEVSCGTSLENHCVIATALTTVPDAVSQTHQVQPERIFWWLAGLQPSVFNSFSRHSGHLLGRFESQLLENTISKVRPKSNYFFMSLGMLVR